MAQKKLTEEELLAQATQAIDDLEAKTQELNDVNTKLTEANTNLETANNQLAEANTQVTTLTEQVNTLTSEKATLQESNETLTSQIGTVTSEKEALESQIVDVRSANHKLVAEKVALAKLFLGKITKEAFDAEVEELIKRTDESLADSMTDLFKESSSIVEIEKLEDPTKQNKKLDTHESKEFESKHDYADFLGSEISKLFK